MVASLLAACTPPSGNRGGSSPAGPTEKKAGDLAQVWTGKTVTIMVGTAPGGSHDTWARALSRHLGRHLPGGPSLIVENVPGYDHRIAANRLYAAKPDGLSIAATTRSLADFQLRDDGPDGGIRYDVAKLGWLGSTTGESEVLVVHSRAGVRDVGQLATKPIKTGHQTLGNSSHVFELILSDALGWARGKRTFGWEGTGELLLAIDRGDIDATVMVWTTTLQRKRDDVAAGAWRVLVQGGRKIDHSLLAGVPTASELLANKDPAARDLLAFWERPYAYSRPYLTPPGLEPSVLAAMRSAFMATMVDPEFGAEVAQLGLTIDPIPGDRLQELVTAQLQTPPAVVERLNALIQADAPS
jgi:tripartite-type tricarboxylate transporter receptor subunit TctC